MNFLPVFRDPLEKCFERFEAYKKKKGFEDHLCKIFFFIVFHRLLFSLIKLEKLGFEIFLNGSRIVSVVFRLPLRFLRVTSSSKRRLQVESKVSIEDREKHAVSCSSSSSSLVFNDLSRSNAKIGYFERSYFFDWWSRLRWIKKKKKKKKGGQMVGSSTDLGSVPPSLLELRVFD